MSASPNAPGLSVFFPAYNDSGTIASMVISAVLAARRLTSDFEVLVINDGSRDATAQVADELARVYPEVRVIHHQGNRGYGGALRSGFAAASKEWIFYTDGDAQYDPWEMAVLWEQRGPGVDMVNGYKISRSDPFHRIVIGRLYHHTVKLLFGLKVRDVDCDFRLMRRAIFDRITLTKSSGVICLEMMKRITDAGFTIVEAPVHHYHRAYGKSQFFNFGRIYHHTVKLLFGLEVRDVDCDFRLIRRTIFDRVELTKNSGVICLEMMKKITDAGFTIVEAPVHHYHRAYGKSQFFNFGRILRTVVDVLKLWWALVVSRNAPEAGPTDRSGT